MEIKKLRGPTTYTQEAFGYVNGWNDCVDKLLTWKTAFQKIARFNEMIGNGKGSPEEPRNLSCNYINTQWLMVVEEFDELFEALQLSDHSAIRDGIADVLVTVYGLAHRLGIDADADLEAVNESNMSKFVMGTFEDARQAAMDICRLSGLQCHWAETVPNIWAITSLFDQVGEDGKQYPEGKLLKPSTFKPPLFK